jgi:Protein of unknown function (DUF3592)
MRKPMTLRRSAAMILTFIGIIFLLTGFLLAKYLGKPMVEQAKASKNWPTTEGIIKTSEVIEKRDDDGLMYSVNVLYSYTVNDQAMESNSVWFSGGYSSSNREEFQRTVNEYPVGNKVKVYYKPDDPVIAVLEPGAFTSTYILLYIGRTEMGIGALLLIISMFLLRNSGSKTVEDEAQEAMDIFQQDNPYAENHNDESYHKNK